jgi:hypothetical protein
MDVEEGLKKLLAESMLEIVSAVIQ